MSKFDYSRELVRSIRHMFGFGSPMNVFPKTFTRTPSVFEEMAKSLYDPSPTLAGTTVKVRMPQRLVIGPR